MSDIENLGIHLAIAAAGSWLLILILRWIWKAVNKACFGDKLQEKPVAKQLVVLFDTLLPILPCVPSGLLFMMWPSNAIIEEPLYQFLTGAVAGSMAANLYELIRRIIKKRVKAVLNDVAKPTDPPPAPTS